jgi:hypothetical protein
MAASLLRVMEFNEHMMRFFPISFVFCLAVSGLPIAALADLEKAKSPPRLDLDVMRDRSTKVEGGDWDDKAERVQVRISVTNRELNAGVDGLKAHFWLVVRSAVDRTAYKIGQREEFPISLTNTPDGRKLEHETKEIELRYDTTFAKFGESYHGWLLVILNDGGEIVAMKSTSPAYEKAVDLAMNLNAGDWVDSNFGSAKEPERPSTR